MNKLFLAAIKEETIGLDYFHHVGVGKINATYNTLRLINIYKPKIIINYGTAGAINNKLQGIVECTKFFQRDMDVRSLDFKLGETPFDTMKEIITSEKGYSCGTGDSFVNKKIEIKTDVVDMEAYAIAKVCKHFQKNCIVYKYISDLADSDAAATWVENQHKGADAFIAMT
jgi:adenosylhomocysteine nucleosidase